MKITHKKTWEPLVITLETEKEVRILARILGELSDKCVKDVCKADDQLIDEGQQACKMIDVLYARLTESIE
jgi:ferritin-like metal-binding protein YciE